MDAWTVSLHAQLGMTAIQKVTVQGRDVAPSAIGDGCLCTCSVLYLGMNNMGGTDEVDLPDILLGWCSGLCLLWRQIDPPGDLLYAQCLQSP